MKYMNKSDLVVIIALISVLIFGINHSWAAEALKEEAPLYFQEALQAHKSGDLVSAMSLYIKAIAADPNYAAAYNNLGTIYAQKKDYAKAEEQYNKAVTINPDYPIALKNLALIYAERKDFDKFNEYWRRATGLDALSPFLIDDKQEDED